MGSAAFVVGTLLAGQAAGDYGLSAIVWLSAAALMATPIAASFVPPFPASRASDNSNREIARHPWLTLLRQGAFVRVTFVAALVLGSHAMYDSFAVIRWTQAGISPPTTGVLWSESVAAEILVFLFLGPKLLRVIGPTVALAVAASCGVLRWAVIAQTADVAALALVQPCTCRYRAASFGRHRAGSLRSRRRRGCHRRFDAALRMALCAFRTGRVLGDGSALHGRLPCHLATASCACRIATVPSRP
jgi:MFS_1 like family